MSLSELTQEETDHLNGPTCSKGPGFKVKNLPIKQTRDPDGFTGRLLVISNKISSYKRSQRTVPNVCFFCELYRFYT